MSLLIRSNPCQVYDVLYELVTCSLGGRSVKCVVNQNECIFTSDMETLFSNLNTEHPGVELIIQSLKSHKAQHGEGMRSFLFMTTRIAKAVQQLEQLGIASSLSTSVMQEALDHLSREVNRIRIPILASASRVTSAHDSSLQYGWREITHPMFEDQDKSSQNENEQSMELVGNNSNIKSKGSGEHQNMKDSAGKISFKSSHFKDVESFNKEISTDVMESEIVYLKMSNVSKTEEVYDNDIDWIFEKTTDTVADLEHYGKEDDEAKKLMMGHNFDRFRGELSAVSGKCKIHENRSQQVSLTSSYNKENNQYDSDFEDCFDDIDDSKNVTLVGNPDNGNVNMSTTAFNESKTNTDSVKGEMECGSILENAMMNNEYKKSCSLRINSHATNDEFNESLSDGAGEVMKVNQEKVARNLSNCEQNSEVFAPSHIALAHSGESETFYNMPGNIELKSVKPFPNYSSMKNETSPSQEIAKLDSLLKQIGHRKTHNIHQVMVSSRYNLKGDDSEKQRCEDHIESSCKNMTKSNSSIQSKLKHEDTNLGPSSEEKSMEGQEVMKTKSVEMPVTGKQKSDTTEVTKIDALLKHLSVKNTTVQKAQVVTSSRHMRHIEKSKHSKEMDSADITLQPKKSNLTHNTRNELDSTEVLNLSSLDELQGHRLKNPSVDTNNGKNMVKDFSHLESNVNIKPEIRIPDDACCLSRDLNDLMELVKDVYCLQSKEPITDTTQKRFDLKKFHCVSNQSSNCFKKVVKGLVVACGNEVMEKIGTASESNTILVNGDLKPNFVHKGYKHLASKRVITETYTESDSYSLGKEQKWALKAIHVIKKLNIGALLIKGRVSDILLDMLTEENITAFTNVPYHVIEIVSHTLKVKPVSYLQDAKEADVCRLCFQPLDESWMDCQGNSHCLIISNIPDTQTVVLQLSSVQACQVEEEKVWKCFHRLCNAMKDGCVLPGYGMTEAWCERQIRQMAEEGKVTDSTSCSNLYLQKALILQALGDVFQDFVSIVRSNVKTSYGEYLNQLQPVTFSHLNTTPGTVTTPRYNDVSDSEDYSCQHLKKSSPSDIGCKGFYERSDTTRLKDFIRKNDDGKEIWCIQNEPYCSPQYDTFSSKVSAWSSSLDLVQVLFSLDSLVVTGASSSDLSPGDVLL